jgi:hypothetical protein
VAAPRRKSGTVVDKMAVQGNGMFSAGVGIAYRGPAVAERPKTRGSLTLSAIRLCGIEPVNLALPEPRRAEYS